MIQSLSMQITSSDSHDKQNTLWASKTLTVWCSLLADMKKIGKIRKKPKLHRGNINKGPHRAPTSKCEDVRRGRTRKNNLHMQAAYKHRARSQIACPFRHWMRQTWNRWFVISWPLDISSSSALWPGCFIWNRGWKAISDPRGNSRPSDLNLHLSQTLERTLKDSTEKSLKIRHTRGKLCRPR